MVYRAPAENVKATSLVEFTPRLALETRKTFGRIRLLSDLLAKKSSDLIKPVGENCDFIE